MELTPIKSNCTELKLNDYIVLFSYKTPVAYQSRKTGRYFVTDKKWSRTTSKHITQWLRDNGVSELDVINEPQEVLDSLVK